MNIDKYVSAGTILTLVLFLIVQTVAGVRWAATVSADIKATRAWQIRQDDRLKTLEKKQNSTGIRVSAVHALIGTLRNEVEQNSSLLLQELRKNRD